MTAARTDRFWSWYGAALVLAALLSGLAIYGSTHSVPDAQSFAGRAPVTSLGFGPVAALLALAIPVLAWVALLWQATRCSGTRTHQSLCLAQALMVGVAFVCFAAEDDPPGYPMFRASSPGGAGATLYPTPAGACSWSDIDRTNADRLIPEFFNYADTVVHGRVVSVQINEDGVQTAQVAVLRSFKGADSALQLVEHSGPCGYRFKVGERRIYFITGTTVGAAGVKRASSWMWAVLSGLDRTAEIAVVPKPVVKSSRVRIRNASKTPFFNVVVGGRSYGNIGPNCTTSYQRWPAAYRYSSVSLIADAEERKLGVIDYVGESPLGEGRFTYVLTYENRQLGMRTVKDGN